MQLKLKQARLENAVQILTQEINSVFNEEEHDDRGMEGIVHFNS